MGRKNKMEINHVELYKKYRPDTWDKMIGQTKIVKSLQSAVKNNKLPTAYLFSGQRGTGKTTAALLLAKSINCLHPDKNCNPCNECEVCKSIDEGSQIGVTYLSAAQSSGVEDIRQLVQQARLSVPIKKQVIIIDEIHNLKQGKGFEALLIPLEEKNMPALFILCTTEIEKVPQTILSRVQSRKFSLISPDLMNKYVHKILEKEAVSLSENVINDVVRHGRGSVRDTLTSLESTIETGETESQDIDGKILESISNKNIAEAFKYIAISESEGTDQRETAEKLFEDLRNILLVSVHADKELIGNIPVESLKDTVKGLCGIVGINIVINEISDCINRMAYGSNWRINLEIAVTKSIEKLKKIQKLIDKKENTVK